MGELTHHIGTRAEPVTCHLHQIYVVWDTSILNGNYESKRLQVVLDSVFILNISFSSLIGQF